MYLDAEGRPDLQSKGSITQQKRLPGIDLSRVQNLPTLQEMVQNQAQPGTVEGLHADSPHRLIVGVEMQDREETIEGVGEAERNRHNGTKESGLALLALPSFPPTTLSMPLGTSPLSQSTHLLHVDRRCCFTHQRLSATKGTRRRLKSRPARFTSVSWGKGEHWRLQGLHSLSPTRPRTD